MALHLCGGTTMLEVNQKTLTRVRNVLLGGRAMSYKRRYKTLGISNLLRYQDSTNFDASYQTYVNN